MSDMKTVYHGSAYIVKVPIYGYGKINNDYGIGFYCTQDNRAGSFWSVNKGEDGYNNKYEIDTEGLKILNLDKDDILLWMAILLNNRIANNLDDDVEFIRKKFIKPGLFMNLNSMVIIVKTHIGFEFFEFLH